MGYKAAVQVLKQAEELKIKVSQKSDWLNNNEVWVDQQKLQNIYQQVLVLDLEYALDKKVEQDLWTIGFKNHISSLQEQARDKKNLNRSDCQALLTWALESASGFYINLLQELCNTFDVDFPFRRKGNVYGQIINLNTEVVNLPQTSSCLYICQYCLVHLGDIARYRNQRKQAENFYKQAILVSPFSGHPYNQLALLEASRGNKLSTVFYYIRSIAVKNPFPASATNLTSTLNSTIDKESSVDKIPTKMTVNEFIQHFLCTHGYFHLVVELKQAELAVKSLNSIITALVATQGFTSQMLIKITIINLYALKHVESSIKQNELTQDEKKVRELVLELIAGSLCAFLVPIHTLKATETLLEYYALPAVKILLYFIQHEPDILRDKVFGSKLLIWPSLVKLVNNVQKYLKGNNFDKYSKHPLPEDKYLQGFLPLTKHFQKFDFKEEVNDAKIEKLLRIKRIVDITLWLTELDVNGNKLVVKTEINGELHFEPGSVQPDPTNELLEEMKSFSINSSGKGMERKAGILKPQGSLEKSREEREMATNSASEALINVNKLDFGKNKRGKQNIALQSIFKKMEESNKQVKFIMDEPEKDKFDQLPPQQQKPPSNTQNQNQFNMPLRTQSFNQNHPAFPLPSSQQSDYLLNLRSQVDKSLNYHFPKNDNLQPNLPNMSMHILPPYQNTQNKNVNVGLNQKTPNYSQNLPQSSFSNSTVPGAPYQNIPFAHTFNTWKRDEVSSLGGQAWWQNSAQNSQQSQNYRQPSYPHNFQNYQNNVPHVGPIMQPGSTNNRATSDMFNLPWTSYNSAYLGETNTSLDGIKQNMSIRQAMLKEANLPVSHIAPPDSPLTRLSTLPTQDINFSHNATNAPGYSLFNTNSWTPNLAGQLINSKHSENSMNLQQQSLFSGHGPKSLAQLLEHQQNQVNKTD